MTLAWIAFGIALGFIHGGTSQKTGDVRLVGGLVPSAGRVEYYQNGQWGTICDDGWGINECDKVCTQLGWSGAYQANGYAIFGEGTGPIQLSYVNCGYSWVQAQNISQCSKIVLPTNCNHNEDASCVCCTNTNKTNPCARASLAVRGCDAVCQATLPVNRRPRQLPRTPQSCNLYLPEFGTYSSNYGYTPEPTGGCDYSRKYTCINNNTMREDSYSHSAALCAASAQSSASTSVVNSQSRCGGIDCFSSTTTWQGTENCQGAPEYMYSSYTGGECFGGQREVCDNQYLYYFSYNTRNDSCVPAEEYSWSRYRLNVCIGAANYSTKYTGCSNPQANIQMFTNAMGARISQFVGADCSGVRDLQSEIRTGYCDKDYGSSSSGVQSTQWFCGDKQIWNYQYLDGNCGTNLSSVLYIPLGCTDTALFGTTGQSGIKKWQSECLPAATVPPTMNFGGKNVVNAVYFYDGTCAAPLYGFYDVLDECDSGIKYECVGNQARLLMYHYCDCAGPVNTTIVAGRRCQQVPQHRCYSRPTSGSNSYSSTTYSERWLAVLSCGATQNVVPADVPPPTSIVLSSDVRRHVGFSELFVVLCVLFLSLNAF